MTKPQKSEASTEHTYEWLDDILNEFGNWVLGNASWIALGGETDGSGAQKAKQAITAKISKIVDEIIGEDDKVNNRMLEVTTVKNEAKNELRAELRKRKDKVLRSK